MDRERSRDDRAVGASQQARRTRVIPHLEHPHHADASLANAERWAARIPAPTYAIDDETAISVVDGRARVVSEGQWRLFQP